MASTQCLIDTLGGEKESHLNCLKDMQLVSLSSDELGIRSPMLLQHVPGELP